MLTCILKILICQNKTCSGQFSMYTIPVEAFEATGTAKRCNQHCVLIESAAFWELIKNKLSKNKTKVANSHVQHLT